MLGLISLGVAVRNIHKKGMVEVPILIRVQRTIAMGKHAVSTQRKNKMEQKKINKSNNNRKVTKKALF